MKKWKKIILIVGVIWGLLNGLKYSTAIPFLVGSITGGLLLSLATILIISKAIKQKVFS